MRLLTFILALMAHASFAQDREPNHLLGAQSPYLLQHLYNPVDWYPWGTEALDRARDENKLIFVSIGYSSCHWCHVMADESFEDDTIAAFLNEHFIAIKIDRERRPDLDEQFMLATQLIAGGGGWPNSVFLTPTGDPFFAGTYFPPAQFLDLQQQIVALWQADPNSVIHDGTQVSTLLRDFMSRKAEAQELTPDLVLAVAQDIAARTDPFSGGLGDTAKFPQEPLFLFLLDQATRTGDTELLAGVTNMLDAMIRGGIHDHVGGGFHRYTVDPDWRVPHFEKMLYNQAMSGRLLVRAWAATDRPAYRRAAERLFDYVLRDLRDTSGGFMAAEDADSDDGTGGHVEGAFYTWDYDLLGEHPRPLEQFYDISPDGDLDGANVLNLIDNTDILANEMAITEPELFAQLDPMLDILLEQRQSRLRPGLDSKVLMGWNGAMIATLAEAGHVLERPDYLDAAATAANHILTNMRNDTGFYRVWYKGQAGTPAQLGDYASLGLGLVALHDYAPQTAASDQWLTQAHALANQIRTRFGSPQDGFRMNEVADGFSTVTPMDDGEIPSGNAMALDLFARLAKRMPAPDMELNATRLAGALSGHALEIPGQRGATLQASQELQFGEVGPLRHVASGAVRVALNRDRAAGRVRLDIRIADGWHLNAHEPLEDYFIPVEFQIGDTLLPTDAYPPAQIKSLGFNPKPLALYEGTFSLEGPAPETGEAVLILQACNDEICLQPQELRFRLW